MVPYDAYGTKNLEARLLVATFVMEYYRFPLLELFKLEARFVLRQGQHVNNMEENTNYRSLQCNSLGQILKNKGIPHSIKRKRRTN